MNKLTHQTIRILNQTLRINEFIQAAVRITRPPKPTICPFKEILELPVLPLTELVMPMPRLPEQAQAISLEAPMIGTVLPMVTLKINNLLELTEVSQYIKLNQVFLIHILL